MFFSNLLIPALHCCSNESDLAVCKSLHTSVTATSPETPASQSSEGALGSEMTSESENSGGRHEAGAEDSACRGGASPAAARSSDSCAREIVEDACSLLEVPEENLSPEQSEMDVSVTADDTPYDTDSSRVSIDDMPDEILIKIFSHMSFGELVDVVQKVSSRWKRLSQDVELWTNKEYEIRSWNDHDSHTCKGGRTDREAIQAFCDAPNLRSLSMRRGARAGVFRALCDRCHRLSELRLHYTQKLSYSVLKNLVEKCSGIQKLRISNELLKCERVSRAVSQLQQLRVLDMDEYFLETPVLRPLGDGCPRLAEVDFGSVTLDMDDLRYFLNAKRSTLRVVRIKWTMVGRRCVLPLLTVCADSLEYLQLYEFDLVRDEAREAFSALAMLKNLQELKMSLTDTAPPGTAALAFKAGGLPKLQVLDLRDSYCLEDNTVAAVCRGCPALRELCVRGAELLTDAAFSQVHRLQRLEMLDVSCCKGLGGGLVPWLARLPRLRALFLEELEMPRLLPGLAALPELAGLRHLALGYSLVTGVPFDKFPGKLLNLRELNIQWCRGDSKAIDGLTERMPDLEIRGNIEEEEPSDMEGHESDADLPEEENDENDAPGNEDDAQEGNLASDEDSDTDSDGGSSSDSESESEKLIWGESGISVLFLEDANEQF